MLRSIRLGALTFALVTTASCIDDGSRVGHNQQRLAAGGHALTYVGKQSNITDFTGYGQLLYYFPLFGLTSPETGQRTDERTVYYSGIFREFEHHRLLDLETRTFSPDAYGSPLGVKTKGGFAHWPVFTLPNGQTGRAGAVYDDATLDENSNNTINQVITLFDQPSDFCLNIITDNTAGENNPDKRFEARLDSGGTQIDFNLAGHPDFTFDGQPDMYTFRYEGMNDDERFKIRLSTFATDEGKGAGFGGIMVSDISTCTANAEADAGAAEVDADVGGEADAQTPTSNDATVATAADAGGGQAPSAGCGCQTDDRPAGAWVLLLAVVFALRRSSKPRRARAG